MADRAAFKFRPAQPGEIVACAAAAGMRYTQTRLAYRACIFAQASG